MSRNKKEMWEKHRFFFFFLGSLTLVKLSWEQREEGKNKAQDNQQTVVKLIICVNTGRLERLSSFYFSFCKISPVVLCHRCYLPMWVGVFPRLVLQYSSCSQHCRSSEAVSSEDWAESRNKISRGLHWKLIFQGRTMAVFPFLFKSPQRWEVCLSFRNGEKQIKTNVQ